jgi:hypothetical protein
MFDSGDQDPGTPEAEAQHLSVSASAPAVADPAVADVALSALVSGALAPFSAAVEGLQQLNLTSWPDEAVLMLARGLETQKTRQATTDHLVVAEIEQRGLARDHGCASTAVLLAQMLHIVLGEAQARVKAAVELGPRRSLTGQPLEPIYESTAAHVAAGLVSPRHAAIITHAVRHLPPALAADIDLIVEGVLLEHAQQMDPTAFARFARDLIERLDQDGSPPDEGERRRHRDLSIRQRPDGSAKLTGELDATTTEALLSVLDTLARPNPTTTTTENDGAAGGANDADSSAGTGGADGSAGAAGSGASASAAGGARQADPRTAGQRRHDGLRDALLMLLRSGQLPACGGIAASIILTMSSEQARAHTEQARPASGEQAWTRGSGQTSTGSGHARSGSGLARRGSRLVRTGHGATITVKEAFTLLGDTQIEAVVLDSLRKVSHYSSTHRFFTQGQRLAMAARDGGCSFTGCTIPPAWCESHHMTDFAVTGKTTIDDGTLLCGFHHREHEALGWTCHMINGTPHWTAPRWLDPDQTPRRNTAHHTDLEFRAPKPRPEADPPSEADPPPDADPPPEADPPPVDPDP